MAAFENLDIYLLLLAAVVAGWLLGRLGGRLKPRPRDSEDIFHDYFVGLNYLLNDEPDEAIDTFIKALEVNSETVETHLALGALLRRRGKVDKAIKVHQTLLARQGLDRSFFDSTRLQLALDYIAAGLLDRAERLLKEIRDEKGEARWKALQHLLTVYQTEKEWELALDCIRELLNNPEYKKNNGLRSIAAHYCCELGEAFMRRQQSNRAREQLKRAFTFDRKHTRTALLLARLERSLGNDEIAIRELIRIRRQHPEFSGQVLQLLMQWYAHGESDVELLSLLEQELQSENREAGDAQADVPLLLAIAELLGRRDGAHESLAFLERHYQNRASLDIIVRRLQLYLDMSQGDVRGELTNLQSMLESILRNRMHYQCNHCGYESRNLYWLCPSCQNWDKTKPIVKEIVR